VPVLPDVVMTMSSSRKVKKFQRKLSKLQMLQFSGLFVTRKPTDLATLRTPLEYRRVFAFEAGSHEAIWVTTGRGRKSPMVSDQYQIPEIKHLYQHWSGCFSSESGSGCLLSYYL
jgi:hypothetical protein